MRRLIPSSTAGNPAVIGNRDRRKAYYHGKYTREVGSVLVFVVVVAFFLVRLNS